MPLMLRSVMVCLQVMELSLQPDFRRVTFYSYTKAMCCVRMLHLTGKNYTLPRVSAVLCIFSNTMEKLCGKLLSLLSKMVHSLWHQT